jgi:hypothetical protein
VELGSWPAELADRGALPAVVTRGDPVHVTEHRDSRREVFWRVVCSQHSGLLVHDFFAEHLAVADAIAHRKEAHADMFDVAVRVGHLAGEPAIVFDSGGPGVPDLWRVVCRCGTAFSSEHRWVARAMHAEHVEAQVTLARTLNVLLCGTTDPGDPRRACTMPAEHGPFRPDRDGGLACHGEAESGTWWAA